MRNTTDEDIGFLDQLLRKFPKKKPENKSQKMKKKFAPNPGYGVTDYTGATRTAYHIEKSTQVEKSSPRKKKNIEIDLPDDELEYFPPKRHRKENFKQTEKSKSSPRKKTKTKIKPSSKSKKFKERERSLLQPLAKDEFSQFMQKVRSCNRAISGKCSGDNCDEFARCFKYHLSSYRMQPPILTNNKVLHDMSGSAAKVFMYIISQANNRNNAADEDYGSSVSTYQQISDVSGVSKKNMRKYLDELCDLGLIETKTVTISNYAIIHNAVKITLLWYRHKRRMQSDYEKLVLEHD